MRTGFVFLTLGVVYLTLPGCGEHGGVGRGLAHKPRPPAGSVSNSVPRRTPAYSDRRRSELAKLLYEKISHWLPGLRHKISAYALIIDTRTPNGRIPTPPRWRSGWSESDAHGTRFSADWVSGNDELFAEVYLRSRGRYGLIKLPLLNFIWDGHRWRSVCPSSWTSADRRKFRHFVYLTLAGKLPTTIKGIQALLPGSAKIRPLHRTAHVSIGPPAQPGR